MADWLRSEISAMLPEVTGLGDSVTYKRGAYTVLISAQRGSIPLRIGDTVVRPDCDFLFQSSELVLNGSRTLPMIRDRIEVAENGQTVTYEVMSPGEPESHYRETAGMLRVHTMRIGLVS